MVRKRANPINIWLGGVCCVERAFLSSENTTIILVKEVSRVIIDGASVKTVSSNSICILLTHCDGSSSVPKSMLILGIGRVSGAADTFFGYQVNKIISNRTMQAVFLFM
jgi:hypothetical protein